MSRAGAFAAVATLALAAPAAAQDELRAGFEGALRGCEAWVLEPDSWGEGFAPFLKAMSLGNTAEAIDGIAEEAQPPEPWRVANHYWRINSTRNVSRAAAPAGREDSVQLLATPIYGLQQD